MKRLSAGGIFVLVASLLLTEIAHAQPAPPVATTATAVADTKANPNPSRAGGVITFKCTASLAANHTLVGFQCESQDFGLILGGNGIASGFISLTNGNPVPGMPAVSVVGTTTTLPKGQYDVKVTMQYIDQRGITQSAAITSVPVNIP